MKKTIAERIAEFREKHAEVDQSHFPNIILTWQAGKRGEKKNIFYDTSKVICGEKIPHILTYNYDKNMSTKPCYVRKETGSFFRYEPSKTYLTYSGAELKSSYFKEDKRFKVMEVSVCTFDTSRYHIGDTPRKWVRDENTTTAYFIDGKKIPYDKYGRVLYGFEVFKRTWGSPKQAIYANKKEWSRFILGSLYSKKSAENFAHFAQKSLVVAKGVVLNPYYKSSFVEWFNYNATGGKSTGPKSRKINALNALVKENISVIEKENNCIHNKANHRYIYPEILDKNTIVFRYFSTFAKNLTIEGFRVFADSKHNVYCSRWDGKEWCISQMRSIPSYYYYYYGYMSQEQLLEKEAIKNFKPFQYIYEAVEGNFSNAQYVEKLLKISNSPMLERILKSSYPDIGRLLEEINDIGDDEKILSSLFAPLPIAPKGKGFQSKIGLNQYQLNFFNNKVREALGDPQTGERRDYSKVEKVKKVIKIIKMTSCCNNIAPLTNEQFNEHYLFAEQIYETGYCEEYFETIKTVLNKEEQARFWSRVCAVARKIPTTIVDNYGREKHVGGMHDTWHVVKDLLKTWKNLPETDRPKIDCNNWKTLRDIERTHNSYVALELALKEKITMEQDKAKYEVMVKTDRKRKEFEYNEDNEDFFIKLPERPYEITMEGRLLSHCVNGYVDDHVRGFTTIFFLRRKDFPNKPFYTIEVRGIGKKDTIPRIVQIHGFGNKWLGNDPDAIPTVMRWLRKNHIICEDRILLSTAKGYSNYNSPMVEKPII